MRLYKTIAIAIILVTCKAISAQDYTPSNIYTNPKGQVYVKVDAPIYFFVSPQTQPNNLIQIPSNDSLANPMYFDGPGRHYLVYNNKQQKVRYMIIADAKGPKAYAKAEKGLLFGTKNRLYVDLGSSIMLGATDDYSGTKSIFYSINGLPFQEYTTSIPLNEKGETEIKLFATDNVSNSGDTATYKIIISPEALFQINNIYFETGSAKLLPESHNNLEEMLQIMQNFPELMIDIGAHADARGSAQSNQKLSERRAKSVAKHLISKGIHPKRLRIHGYGDTRIINTCTKGVSCPDSQHRENRRVEFKLSLPK
ncbi:MAG: OmpA family protein [Bacteroidales bacterium]|nr:OmpA family protein [Bacteroidales bacterium]